MVKKGLRSWQSVRMVGFMSEPTNIVKIWRSEMADRLGLDAEKITLKRAAELLGKTLRAVQYYEEGREVPRDTLLLMDAYMRGYRPSPHMMRGA